MDKVVAALVAFLTALSDKFLLIYAGGKIQQSKDVKRDLEAIQSANQAVRGLDGMYGDERLRELRRRGLLRVSGQQAKRD